jgi:hypothetical protein
MQVKSFAKKKSIRKIRQASILFAVIEIQGMIDPRSRWVS